MLTLFHNPRCSKSRDALRLLEQQPLPFQIIDYTKQPLTEDQLHSMLLALNINARQLLRTNESAYTALNLANPALSELQVIQAMINEPRLIQRPILRKGNKAVIGRPLSNIQDLLQ